MTSNVLNLAVKHVYGFAPETFDLQVNETMEQHIDVDGVDAILTQISFSVHEKVTFHLMHLSPKHERNAPCFLFLNKWGNHTVIENEVVRISDGWTDTGEVMPRGVHKDRFCAGDILKAGYGLATIHESDIAPDTPDAASGVRVHIPLEAPEGERWGTIAAWSWGLSRGIDVLTQHSINSIIVTGHSRRGKAALWCGVNDDRVKMICPHQSGTGGATPFRKTNSDAETVARINEVFPHWFCENFHSYNSRVDDLPFSQSDLLATCFPRLILLLNADQDLWSDPSGAEDIVRALHVSSGADENVDVYDMNKALSCFVRPGEHGWSSQDWRAMIEFANRHL